MLVVLVKQAQIIYSPRQLPDIYCIMRKKDEVVFLMTQMSRIIVVIRITRMDDYH